jgi:hypothetical protein
MKAILFTEGGEWELGNGAEKPSDPKMTSDPGFSAVGT